MVSQQKTRSYERVFFRVAGPGFEPGSSGYEPDEIPLLYPAITLFSGFLVYIGPK